MIPIHRLHLTDVSPAPHLPWTRPTFPVFGFLVLHPTGPILVDSGVGIGNRFIDGLYSPVHHDINDALGRHGVAVDDVRTVVTSHLHFDHCGQNSIFTGARILVQRAEVEAAREPLYTVPEWAFPPGIELTEIDGDHDVVDRVRILSTPGHTAGHQSVVIDDGPDSRTIVCCQATWNVASFAAAELGDDGWDADAGATSLHRLHALAPTRVLLSHDPAQWPERPAERASTRNEAERTEA